MSNTSTPRRFYIDRNDQQNEPVVRTVAVHRSIQPATHQVDRAITSTPSQHRDHHLPRVGKLVQSAIRRRVG